MIVSIILIGLGVVSLVFFLIVATRWFIKEASYPSNKELNNINTTLERIEKDLPSKIAQAIKESNEKQNHLHQ